MDKEICVNCVLVKYLRSRTPKVIFNVLQMLSWKLLGFTWSFKDVGKTELTYYVYNILAKEYIRELITQKMMNNLLQYFFYSNSVFNNKTLELMWFKKSLISSKYVFVKGMIFYVVFTKVV